MVAPGQFLERPAIILGVAGVLEGLSHRGNLRPPLLVLSPDPDRGGSMDHVVAAEIVWAAAMAGFPSVRFNYRGVGASAGQRGGAEEHLADAESALRFCLENVATPSVAVAAIGGSVNTAWALRRGHPEVSGLCLISPSGAEPSKWGKARLPLQVIVGEHEKEVPRASLSAAVANAGGELEVVLGADAAFLRNLPQVGKTVVRWLQGMERG